MGTHQLFSRVRTNNNSRRLVSWSPWAHGALVWSPRDSDLEVVRAMSAPRANVAARRRMLRHRRSLVPALSERLRAYDRKLRCGELPESPDHRGLREELLPRDACASNAGGAPFAVKIRRSSHGRFEWEELLCPGSSSRPTYMNIAARARARTCARDRLKQPCTRACTRDVARLHL